MQPEESNARQLLVERIRQSTNILIAVSTDPSVDALSAALALALVLNKMDKHATAVFSGKMPPAMDFLEPGKTFENTVDSLRDFIISLDKEKADRLRYKVENDVVRIFITPYKTTITQKDLQFSQGDFNVELIIALGVEKREDLDKAIVAHGRILHDATVATINPSNQRSALGAVDWHDSNASSLCEMLVSLGEAFQQPGLLDTQIATALLTGIVSATERFSNSKTNPKVMTMAAQLMAAGANQQLIATNLGKARTLTAADIASSGELVPGGSSVKVAIAPEPAAKKDGELDISHTEKSKQKQPQKSSESKPPKKTAEDDLAAALPVAEPPAAAFAKLKTDLEAETKAEQPKASPFLQEKQGVEAGSSPVNIGDSDGQPNDDESYIAEHSSWRGKRLDTPQMGGTLNATAEQALQDEHKAEDEQRNKTILSHDREQPNTDQPKDQPPAPEPLPPPPPIEQPPIEPPAPVDTSSSEPPAMPPLPVVEPTAPLAPAAPFGPPLPEALASPPVTEPAQAPNLSHFAPLPPPLPTPPALTSPPLDMPATPPPSLEPTLPPAPEPLPPPPPPEPPAVSEAKDQAVAEAKPVETASHEIDAARQAVTDALDSQAFDPANNPAQSAGTLPLGGPLNTGQPDLAPPPEPVTTPLTAPGAMTIEPLPPMPPMPPLPQSDPSNLLPPPPPMPDLPTAPPSPLGPPPPPEPVEPTPPAPSDPGQFKIPGA